MNTLVIVEHDHHTLQPTTFQVLTAARQFNVPITLLVVGYRCQNVVQQAAQLAGVDKVLWADAPCYEHLLAENISELVTNIAQSFTFILAAATTHGKNFLPRVAAMLDVAQISDVTRIVAQDTFEHPIYAGNAIETVQVLDEKKVLTIRATAFDSVVEKQPQCEIESLEEIFPVELTQFVDQREAVSARPDLPHAKIIVSGGRGLQNAEKFKLIEELADALGAAVGASRAAVDAGFIANEHQVGQTGKIVAPNLYIAIGISGAIQHIAGIKDSKIIVAINKDPDAPIFQIANYGLVGDLFEVVPQLIRLLK